MSYFVVFQNKTYNYEIPNGILWAPNYDKNGNAPKFHWQNLTLCQPGDVIFSIVNNHIKARSIVINPAVISNNPFINDNNWNQTGWKVDVQYSLVENKIKIADNIYHIREYLPDRYSPFNRETGRGNQGYLFELPREIGVFFDDLITGLHLTDVQNEIYNISTQEALIMEEIVRESGIDAENFIIVEENFPIGTNRPQTTERHVHYSKIDYLSKAEKDIEKGILAERLVLTYEKNYLIENGRDDLAERVKWIAKEADGYGYDVLSYDLEGNEKYIEVKATSLGKKIPFNMTINELDTSVDKGNKYWIYRVYNINSNQPKFYKVQAPFNEILEFIPIQFKTYIR